MTYLEQLQKESRIQRDIDKWIERRKELCYLVSDYYTYKGPKFIKELEKLMDKYSKVESQPVSTFIQQIKDKA